MARQKTFVLLIVTIVVLLSIPLIAMQFTNEVQWSLLDFVVMGGLLLGLGLSSLVVYQIFQKRSHRLMVLFGLLFVFLMIWAELSVGVFGSPIAGS